VLKGAGLAALVPIAYRPETASAARQREPLSVPALERRLQSRFATNGTVRLHYEIAGAGPLILFVHGFPAWWWTWRDVMAPLADRFTVAAMDTRGYNLSDKPLGVENYEPLLLAGDLRAVIEQTGDRSATVVGHDWGGALSWLLAIISPQVVDRLVILNMPHPSELAWQLAHSARQRDASRYVRVFQQPGALSRPLPDQLGGGAFTAENLAKQLNRPSTAAYERDVAALRRTSLQAALNYYVAGYPKPPYAELQLPKVKAPTLVIYGRDDPVLLIDGLDRTWDRVEPALDIRVVPDAGH
jgi:pimeloyl-ACP methyl ester carboxylesterase